MGPRLGSDADLVSWPMKASVTRAELKGLALRLISSTTEQGTRASRSGSAPTTSCSAAPGRARTSLHRRLLVSPGFRRGPVGLGIGQEHR